MQSIKCKNKAVWHAVISCGSSPLYYIKRRFELKQLGLQASAHIYIYIGKNYNLSDKVCFNRNENVKQKIKGVRKSSSLCVDFGDGDG